MVLISPLAGLCGIRKKSSGTIELNGAAFFI